MKVIKPTVVKLECERKDYELIHNARKLVEDIVLYIEQEQGDGLYDEDEGMYMSAQELGDLEDKLHTLSLMLDKGILDID